MVAGQQSILEQKYLMTCQLKFVSTAKKRVLVAFKKKNHFSSYIYFDTAYSTLCSSLYPSIYISVLHMFYNL